MIRRIQFVGKATLTFVSATCLVSFCLMAACSKKLEGAAGQEAPTSQPAQSSAPVAQSQPQPPPPAPSSAGASSSAAQSAEAPPATTQSTLSALASSDGEMPGVTVAIREIKGNAAGVTLKMVYINSTSKDVDMVWLTGGRDLSAVHLLDTSGKKRYFVVTDSEGHCVCSAVGGLNAGAQLPVWAKFPPVPSGVQKITVEVPRFPPLEDIPITR